MLLPDQSVSTQQVNGIVKHFFHFGSVDRGTEDAFLSGRREGWQIVIQMAKSLFATPGVAGVVEWEGGK